MIRSTLGIVLPPWTQAERVYNGEVKGQEGTEIVLVPTTGIYPFKKKCTIMIILGNLTRYWYIARYAYNFKIPSKMVWGSLGSSIWNYFQMSGIGLKLVCFSQTNSTMKVDQFIDKVVLSCLILFSNEQSPLLNNRLGLKKLLLFITYLIIKWQ